MRLLDDATKVMLATFQLKGPAQFWWESVQNVRGTNISWELFTQLFLEQYFSAVEKRKRKQKFIELKWKTMSMVEYEARFTALSRFAPAMVSTEIEKCDQFEQGLIPSIQDGLAAEGYDS